MRPLNYFPFSYVPNQPPIQQPIQQPMQMPMQMPRGINFGGNRWQGMQQEPIAPIAPIVPVEAPVKAPFGMDQFLNGANQLFTNVQKYTPYVEQARPMLKNLPTLWKLYKGFKSTPDEPRLANRPDNSTRTPKSSRSSQQSEQPLTLRPSTPKIFQPPQQYLD